MDERRISPNDGKYKGLLVQSTDDVFTGSPNGTWKRTFIRNIAPYNVRLASWPTSHINPDDANVESSDYVFAVLKWIPACAGLAVVVSAILTLLLVY